MNKIAANLSMQIQWAIHSALRSTNLEANSNKTECSQLM
jgi:hypothetical protein